MAEQHEPAWLEQLDELGLESLVKLVLSVLGLLFFLVLVSLLPGIDRLTSNLPLPFTDIVGAGVTVAVVALLLRVAVRSRTVVRSLPTESPESADRTASVVYWGVVLLAVVVAYEGFGTVGRELFEYAGIGEFYAILFVTMALIPLALVLLHVAVYVQARRWVADETGDGTARVQSDAGRVSQILEGNGGVVRQNELTGATGWSKTKVSRVLSRMESEGAISRYQMGREKVVCLPGHEPDFVSPADSDATGQ